MSSINKHCSVSGKAFSIFDADQDFYQRTNSCLPNLSPSERMRRRLTWRNETSLHRRHCDKTGKSIVSVYAANTEFPVYGRDAWWSDSWDPLKFGRTYNFAHTFLDQFFQLFAEVPRLALSNKGENSDYCNFSGFFKNSYMCISGMESENCLYSFFTSYSFGCVDCSNVLYSQFCYECIDGQNLHACQYCQDCKDSSDLLFCKNCLSCEHCIGCVGLYQKKYHIFNQAYSKADYEDFLRKLHPITQNTVNLFENKLKEISADSIFKYYHGSNNENTVGDYVSGCKDVFYSFDIHDAENVAYSHNSPKGLVNCQDSCYSSDGEFLLECLSCNSGYNQIGSMYCWNSSDTFYSDHCFNSSNLLGCIGLRNKHYCIFNKQYSKEQYKQLFPKIIEQMKGEGIWGEFWPMQHSPFPYNETVAQDYFPLQEHEAQELGLNWKHSQVSPNPEQNDSSLAKIAGASSYSVLNQTFKSIDTGKAYKLIKQELDYYRSHQVPIPNKAPNERVAARLKKRNARKFWKRSCFLTGENLLSTYSPSQPEKIASEQAYQRHMFS